MTADLALTPEQVLGTPAGTLAQQPAETLFHIKNAAADLLAAGKALTNHVDLAIDIKWKDRARQLRHEAAKDFGVVHFDEGDVRVTSELGKRVEWDQKALAQIASRIASSGEDPAQYLELTYHVSETKFNAWPQTLRSAFEAARTVKPAKATYRLALMKE
jgi:hypothetical protein